MPRHHRRKAKGAAVAAAAASNNDPNRTSPTNCELSSVQLEDGVKDDTVGVLVGSAGGTNKKQLRNRAAANVPGALVETSSRRESGKEILNSSGAVSTSFWSSPSNVIKSPARKISNVGVAIKRKLKQNFGVSFFLEGTAKDADDSSCSPLSEDHRSGKMLGPSATAGDYYLTPAGSGMRPVPSANTLNRLERQELVLWRRPFQTLKFFFLEVACLIYENTLKLWSNRKYVLLAALTSLVAYFAYTLPGPHQSALRYFEKKLFWCAYWVGLGILSSVGLGTGLHTFLLYLGPHIASVTLAAYECHSLKFPEPPYPDQIICPMSTTSTSNLPPNSSNHVHQQQGHSAGPNDDANTLSSLVAATAIVSLWQIMYKVALESFMWGAGTALGELPPYFMARAARLSGQEPDDEEYQEYIQYIRSTDQPEEQQGFLTRGKMFVEKLVEYAGFWGILACASIPNPFFDLAGITCGHFLVPFATFFSATLIGKAVIKMTIQQVFIILAFSEHHVEALVNRIMYIPIIGSSLQTPFKDYLKQQKAKLHRKPGDPIPHKSSLLGKFFEMIVVVMIGFFLVSLVNSLAQNYHRRRWQSRRRELEAKLH